MTLRNETRELADAERGTRRAVTFFSLSIKRVQPQSNALCFIITWWLNGYLFWNKSKTEFVFFLLFNHEFFSCVRCGRNCYWQVFSTEAKFLWFVRKIHSKLPIFSQYLYLVLMENKLTLLVFDRHRLWRDSLSLLLCLLNSSNVLFWLDRVHRNTMKFLALIAKKITISKLGFHVRFMSVLKFQNELKFP